MITMLKKKRSAISHQLNQPPPPPPSSSSEHHQPPNNSAKNNNPSSTYNSLPSRFPKIGTFDRSNNSNTTLDQSRNNAHLHQPKRPESRNCLPIPVILIPKSNSGSSNNNNHNKKKNSDSKPSIVNPSIQAQKALLIPSLSLSSTSSCSTSSSSSSSSLGSSPTASTSSPLTSSPSSSPLFSVRSNQHQPPLSSSSSFSSSSSTPPIPKIDPRFLQNHHHHPEPDQKKKSNKLSSSNPSSVESAKTIKKSSTRSFPKLRHTTSSKKTQSSSPPSSSASSSSSSLSSIDQSRNSSISSSSTSSILLDLFSGPQTSLHHDTRTGDVISSSQAVSHMDDLIGTLTDSALPPNLQKRSADRNRSKSSDRTKPQKSKRSLVPVPTKTTPLPLPPPGPGQYQSSSRSSPSNLAGKQKADQRLNHDPESQNHPLSRAYRPRSRTPLSVHNPNNSSSFQFPVPVPTSSDFLIDQPPLTGPEFSPSSPHSLASSSNSVMTLKQSCPVPPSTSKIPTIDEIISRYNNPVRLSEIPINTSTRKPGIKSIDEIVQGYSHLLQQNCTATEPQPDRQTGKVTFPVLDNSDPEDYSSPPPSVTFRRSSPPTKPPPSLLQSISNSSCPQNPTRDNQSQQRRRPSSASQNSESSVDSVMREVMGCLEQEKEYPVLSKSRPQTTTPSKRRGGTSTKGLRSKNPDLSSKISDIGRAESSLGQRATSSSKRNSYFSLSSAPNFSSSCAQSPGDEEIARYLKSPKLTTLLKLQRQPSPMTVSLADVGSPTGHPVIIFLGLGCVRYLVALYDELAETLGLRLICIDRWGLGKTSQVLEHNRGFLEWSNVIGEVVDQLKLHRFSILAHSAGAPYALASSLKLGERVQGSVHLLAPWVSMTADGGVNAGNYKWLKYVPNSMIRTAQAAEWKMTGWRLGKPPSLIRGPVGYDANAPLSSKDYPGIVFSDSGSADYAFESEERAYEFGEYYEIGEEDDDLNENEGSQSKSSLNVQPRILNPSVESRLCDWNSSSSDITGHSAKNISNLTASTSSSIGRAKSAHSGLAKTGSLLGKVLMGKEFDLSLTNSPDEFKSKNHRNLHHSASSGKLSHKSNKQSIFESSSNGADQNSVKSSTGSQPSRLPVPRKRAKSFMSTSGNSIPAESINNSSQSCETPKALLGISLMKASYAESLKGGTSDLMAILERNSKPWGFSYGDVYKDLKIWHGRKDEKVSLKGSEWICEVVKKGKVQLNVIEGGDHNLMTNVKVMFEVLESISEEWNQ